MSSALGRGKSAREPNPVNTVLFLTKILVQSSMCELALVNTVLFLAKNSRPSIDVCAGALAWCKILCVSEELFRAFGA